MHYSYLGIRITKLQLEKMPIKSHETCTLREIHTSLHLCPNSLPTALSELPRRLNFTGILIAYEELQLVGWKKEVLMTISEGGLETLKMSMWLCHENPRGLKFDSLSEILGRLIHVKHVRIQSFDFTDGKELQFYGEIEPCDPTMHVILTPVVSGGAFVRFKYHAKPYPVNDSISLIPKKLQSKHSVSFYPLLPSDVAVMKQVQGNTFTYHMCLVKHITFTPPRNAFQRFINHLLSEEYDCNQRKRLLRISSRWLRSYEQQSDWEQRQLKKSEQLVDLLSQITLNTT